MRPLVLLAPLVLAACTPALPVATPAPTAAATAANALVGPTWRAVALPALTGSVAVPAGQTLHVTFGADGQVTGSADCNRMFGRYTHAASGTLSMGDVGQTRMFCGEASLGDAFVQALQQSRTYTVSGQTLTLRTATGGTLLLTSAPASSAADAPAHVGVEWKATAITTGGAAKAVPSGQPLTLTLGADGRASGLAVCNRYGGAYTRTGAEAAAGGLAFGTLASTLMACPQDDVSGRFFDVLRRAATFEATAGTLVVRAPNGDAVAFTR